MPKPSRRLRALVVRSYDFGEADRIVVLLSREEGLIRAVAKGVRRAKSRFGSRLQPFVELDVQLYPGRNLSLITQADTVSYFASGLIDDPRRFTAACTVLEAAESLSQAHEDPALYDLSVKAIVQIAKSDDPILALDAYLLQAMEVAGWAPSLFDCAQCSARGPHHAFHPAAGGAVCVHCRPPGSAEVDPETLHLLWLLAHEHPLEQVLTQQRGAQAHQMIKSYLQYHLERRLKSLQVLDEV
ncbi:DNA repair protein RecO [Corynebacterium pelargi]|uniref:DNA repair protein RecO n=1 Tax=Corynebacterium pelargi TaxID=1471400 RepID=UPI001008F2FA|nr:DNA repair protein RecO [Corynebacterium pelargi]GGG71563.1 DNA repair protein RecO [Corynebacterium pelargi]